MSDECTHLDDYGGTWLDGRCMFCGAIEPGSDLDRLRKAESKINRFFGAIDEIEAWIALMPTRQIAIARALMVDIRGEGE